MENTPLVQHSNFDAAFQDGFVFRSTTGGVTRMTTLRIADLILPSGKILGSDPSWPSDGPPFARSVKPGRYPVHLALACNLRNIDETATGARGDVACAKVSFSSSQPVTWEMALWPGDDPARALRKRLWGYGVDAGTGSFADYEAAARKDRDHWETEMWDPLLNQIEENAYTWGALTLDEATGANLVAFSSGHGDGGYPSWWGFDATNKLICLVTDFALLIEPVYDEVIFNNIAAVAPEVEKDPRLEALGARLKVKLRGSKALEVATIDPDGAIEISISTEDGGYEIRSGDEDGDWVVQTYRMRSPIAPDARMTVQVLRGYRSLAPW